MHDKWKGETQINKVLPASQSSARMQIKPNGFYLGHVIFVFLLVFLTSRSAPHTVQSHCAPTAKVCEFEFRLHHMHTMMHYWHGDLLYGLMVPVVMAEDGSFYSKRKNCSGLDKMDPKDAENVIIGDGRHKKVMVINGQLPGPPVVVYEGQQVVVNVTNDFLNEATSIHWHGMLQHNTPWMDGVGGISHCPISPGHKFNYRFLASPVGTHWYHAHLGTQRTMGLYGPLIVLENPQDGKQKNRGSDPLPEFDGDFYMLVQDLMLPSSFDTFTLVKHEAVSYAYGFDHDNCFNATKQLDGTDCGVVPFESFVINGKGRRYDRQTDKVLNPAVPLETFKVKRGSKYRFRVISASMTFAFRLSIDKHVLNMIASDGSDMKTVSVESVILYGGERYDFWIQADDPDLLGKYWIRVENLESFQNGKPIRAGHAEAILQYENGATGDPHSQRTPCTAERPCVVLNCPFRDFPDEENITCRALTEMRSTIQKPTLGMEDGDEIEEHFLNFHFTGFKSMQIWKPTINGRQYVHPSSPPQTFPESQRDVLCDDKKCVEDFCRCTYTIALTLGKIIQLNLLTTLDNPPGVHNGNAHVVHIHGHHFQVIKIGWPTYTATTKLFTTKSDDLNCANRVCNTVQWTNSSWNAGKIPGIIRRGAPEKDTVVVPVGGYVVLRFKADNPGFWYVHCHVEFHAEEGMSLVLKEGETSQMNAAPKALHQCGDFSWSSQEFIQKVTAPSSPKLITDMSEKARLQQEVTTMRWLAISLGSACMVLLMSILTLVCRYRENRQGYEHITSTG